MSANKLVEWQPAQSQFCGFSGGNLELWSAGDAHGDKAVPHSLLRSHEVGNATCMEWHPSNPNLLAFGTQGGAVTTLDWSTNLESVVKSPKSGRNRACISVSWNRDKSSLLASSFELLKGEHCVVLWDVEIAAGGAEEDERAIVSKLCFEEASASLCWLPQDPHLLAVGTSMGWARIYDTRIAAAASAAEISILAHPGARPRKVRGIRPDPFNSNLLATFSDSAGEVVKIWDLRKGSSAAAKSKLTPSFTVMPHGPDAEGQINPQSAVVDAAWSVARPNVIAIATSHNRSVGLYSTTRAPPDATSRVPFLNISLPEAVKALSWRKPDKREQQASLNQLLIATVSGYTDVEVKESVPLATTALGGSAFGLSRSVAMTTSDPCMSYQGEQTMSERSSAGYSLDAGKNMQVLFDELDAINNNKDRLSGDEKPESDISKASALLELSRVWGWVDRVESMNDESISLTNCGVLDMFKRESSGAGSELNPVLGTKIYYSECRSSARAVCGWTDIWKPEPPLTASSGSQSQVKSKRSEEGVVKDSRRLAAESDDDDDASSDDDEEDDEEEEPLSALEAIIEECEDLDSFERAAAVALWHGNIELAVNVLRRNIDARASKFDANTTADQGAERDEVADKNKELTVEYLQLMSLVTMCIAGYPCPASKRSAAAPSSNNNSMWASMCLHVLEQLEQAGRPETCYLIAACRFLLDILENSARPAQASGAFNNIIHNGLLYLEDRIAFACTFLSDSECVKWLSELCAQCKESGRLEGLLITGFGPDGSDILQQYVDTFDDIQTAALLVGRNVEKIADNVTPPREWLWLYEYRTLLNRWQLFIERASLDVELGKLQRRRPPSAAAAATTSTTTTTVPPSSSAAGRAGFQHGQSRVGGAQASADKKASNLNRILFALPAHSDFPHVHLRCNYCSSSLPVDAMQQQQQQHTAFLRKQRPIINFCPSCKKPLPRCYVCQLYVGLVNPHAEISRVIAQRRRVAESASEGGGAKVVAGAAGGEEDKSDHNILEFGRWLFFCQRCKHGGHAACISDWFSESDRTTCGVNGCTCICQTTDGAAK